MSAMMTTIAALLAVRMLLLLSAVGAFALAYLAMQQATAMTLAVCIAYDVLVLCPLVWLYVARG